MITGTIIQLNNDQLKEAESKLQAIKRYFRGHTPIDCTINYNLRGPINLSLWEVGQNNMGGRITHYSGSDRQVFWMYDKMIEKGLYPADKKQQERDMRKLTIDVLNVSTEAIALRSASQKMIAKRASQILRLIAIA